MSEIIDKIVIKYKFPNDEIFMSSLYECEGEADYIIGVEGRELHTDVKTKGRFTVSNDLPQDDEYIFSYLMDTAHEQRGAMGYSMILFKRNVYESYGTVLYNELCDSNKLEGAN